MLKKATTIIFQIAIAVITLPAVVLAILSIENRDNDGPQSFSQAVNGLRGTLSWI